MAGPSVFISHSIKDPGDEPAEADARTAWTRAKSLLALRTRLHAKLAAAGFDPWLDQRKLDPPAEWRDGLHFALARADGAVLLLDENAVQKSDWVLKEATILTWMRAVGIPVVIVPVLVGVGSKALAARGFGPVKLSEIQALKVGVDAVADDGSVLAACVADDELAGVDAVADAIVAVVQRGFATVPKAKPLTAPDKWVDAVVGHLGDAQYGLMQSMMEKIGLGEAKVADGAALLAALRRSPADEIATYDELKRCVAHELLLAELPKVVNAFRELFLLDLEWRLIHKAIAPLWVNPDSATGVLAAARRPPGKRVIVLNTDKTTTAAVVVLRAFFIAKDVKHLTAALDMGDAADFVTKVRGELADRYFDPDYPGDVEKLAAQTDLAGDGEDEEREPIFAYVDAAVPATYVKAALEDEALRHLTFVVAGGDQAEAVAAAIGDALMMRPPFGERAEADARRALTPITDKIDQGGAG